MNIKLFTRAQLLDLERGQSRLLDERKLCGIAQGEESIKHLEAVRQALAEMEKADGEI